MSFLRCEELQLQKDQMVERQRTIANCLNEVKARKEQVINLVLHESA